MTAAAQAPGTALRPSGPAPRRWRKPAAAGAAVVIAAGAAALWVTAPFRGSTPTPAPAEATSLAPVTARSLSSQTQASGTLGYAGSYSLVVPAAAGQPPGTGSGGQTGPGATPAGTPSGTAGTFTALPPAGQVVRQGQRLYAVNGYPVVLLYGTTPAYRSLSEGADGPDVRQLNTDLVALGCATRSELDPHSSFFGAATTTALKNLQARQGVTQSGELALGQAVFLPTAARVTSVSAALGAPSQPGAPILTATSTARQVTAQVDVTQQSAVKPGQQVTITLPTGQTTPGVVTSLGTVAASPSPGQGGGSGSSTSAGSSSPGGSSSSPSSSGNSAATIEVDIKPTGASATSSLDQAPVQVTITTATVPSALVVPVDALLAQPGGYAVEVAGPHGARHLISVSLGLFDDADGLVQVTGAGLVAGQAVVVPRI